MQIQCDAAAPRQARQNHMRIAEWDPLQVPRYVLVTDKHRVKERVLHTASAKFFRRLSVRVLRFFLAALQLHTTDTAREMIAQGQRS